MAHYDRVIPPGQEGKITAKLKTTNLRTAVNKAITVTTNDPKNKMVRLRLRGKVKEVLSVKPRNQIRFKNVELGKAATDIVSIVGERNRPVEVLDLKSTLPYIKAELSDGRAPWEKSITVTLTEDAPAGTISRGRITFRTNYKERPTAYISVGGVVQGPIRFAPQQINFGAMDIKRPESLTTRVVVQSLGDERFEITKVETTLPRFLKTEVKELVPSKKYEITLQYEGGQERRVVNGRLTLGTTSELQPKIEIPIRGAFRNTHKRTEARAKAGATAATRPAAAGK